MRPWCLRKTYFGPGDAVFRTLLRLARAKAICAAGCEWEVRTDGNAGQLGIAKQSESCIRTLGADGLTADTSAMYCVGPGEGVAAAKAPRCPVPTEKRACDLR